MGRSAKKAWSVAMSLIMALSLVSTAALQAFADEAGAVSAVQLSYDNSYGVRNVDGKDYALMEAIATDDQPGRLDLVDTSGKVVNSCEFTSSSSNDNISKKVAECSAAAFTMGCDYLFSRGADDAIVPISFNGNPFGDGGYSSVYVEEIDGSPFSLCLNTAKKYVDVLDADGIRILHVADADEVSGSPYYGSPYEEKGFIKITLTNGKTQYYQVNNGVPTLAAETQNKVLATFFKANSDGSESLMLVEMNSETDEIFLNGPGGHLKKIETGLPEGTAIRKAIARSAGDAFRVTVIYYPSSTGYDKKTVTGLYDLEGNLTDSFQGISTCYVGVDENKFVRLCNQGGWHIEFSDASRNILSSSSLGGDLGNYVSVDIKGNYVVASGEAGTGGMQSFVFDTEGNLKLGDKFLYSFWKAPFGGYTDGNTDVPTALVRSVYDEDLNVVYQMDSSCCYRDEAITLANGQVVSPTYTYESDKEAVFSPAISSKSKSISVAGCQIGTCCINGGVLSLHYLNNQLARDNGNFIYACDANGKYGAIDAQGNVRLPFEYDAYFDSGYSDFIMVEKDGAWSFLDLSDALKKDPIDISMASISASEFVYDGKSAVVPALTVKDGDKALVEGVDYKVASVDYDLSAGTGEAVIEGMGAYTGTATAAFVVATPDELRFPDVAQSEWYFESCAFAKANGLISGYDNGDFGPVDTLTRAQAAAILQRYFAPVEADAYVADGTENATGMVDVAGSAWYTGAANWAVREGVINGKEQADGSRLFDPEGDITREQLCAIVGNAAAKWCGAVVEGADRTKLDGLLGADMVSVWAIDSVAWGVNVGVINGVATDAGRDVDASASVQRSVMAAVMMNAIQNDVIKR